MVYAAPVIGQDTRAKPASAMVQQAMTDGYHGVRLVAAMLADRVATSGILVAALLFAVWFSGF